MVSCQHSKGTCTDSKVQASLAHESFKLLQHCCLFARYVQAVAIWQLWTGATVLSPLCISMLWALYNAIPPYLILHFALFGRVSPSSHHISIFAKLVLEESSVDHTWCCVIRSNTTDNIVDICHCQLRHAKRLSTQLRRLRACHVAVQSVVAHCSAPYACASGLTTTCMCRVCHCSSCASCALCWAGSVALQHW